MGKKRSRAKQVSAGITHQKPNPILKALRREYRDSMARVQNQLEAHLRGKHVVLTIENPNKNETNKKKVIHSRFVRVILAQGPC